MEASKHTQKQDWGKEISSVHGALDNRVGAKILCIDTSDNLIQKDSLDLSGVRKIG